ncbi:MAG: Gfo/Idh/MocA family oxidoreductase, partial [Verrucomicrobia bacterium]|nr:Gfo/Idh/MocA family oxidoreductase [Verrucomicrobiota bacterium]
MNGFNRRQFLKQTSLAAGATVLLSGTKASGRAIGANNRLRIAVAGLNGRGRSHIGGWLGQDNVEIAYLADVDERVRGTVVDYVNDKVQGKYKCQGIKDIRRALDDPTVDAISIATPNHWHSLMTIWGAQAGKHVYVEKPLSHDVEEGRVAVEAQKRYGVVIQHGTQRRSDAKIAGLHEAIQAGKYGKLKISYGYCCKPRGTIGVEAPSPAPSNVDWNMWRGPAVIHQFHNNYVHYDWHWFWAT